MKHITNTIRPLLQGLRKKGFNGVRFCALEIEEQYLDDYIADGMTETQWNKRQRDYCIFIAEPDLYNHTYEEIPYVEVDVNESAFISDFTEYLQKKLGKDVSINYRPGCFEYECLREC